VGSTAPLVWEQLKLKQRNWTVKTKYEFIEQELLKTFFRFKKMWILPCNLLHTIINKNQPRTWLDIYFSQIHLDRTQYFHNIPSTNHRESVHTVSCQDPDMVCILYRIRCRIVQAGKLFHHRNEHKQQGKATKNKRQASLFIFITLIGLFDVLLVNENIKNRLYQTMKLHRLCNLTIIFRFQV